MQGKSILFPSTETISTEWGGGEPVTAPSVTRKNWLRFCSPKGKRKSPGAAASWIPAALDRPPEFKMAGELDARQEFTTLIGRQAKEVLSNGSLWPEGDRAGCPQLDGCRKVSGATAGKSALKGLR